MKAIKVSLRSKEISKGRRSLYLDFYPGIPDPGGAPDRVTRREFLGYYTYDKPKSELEREHNAEVLSMAELIRQKRVVELNKPEIYNVFEKEQVRIRELGNRSFIDYFAKIADRRGGTNHSNWKSALKYLKEYSGGALRFCDINEGMLEELKVYLLNLKNPRNNLPILSQNSAQSYFNKIKAALKQAFREGFLLTDIGSKVHSIKTAETKRSFLTIEELNKLASTDCKNQELKDAALFASLTGLRFCDVQGLTWSDIEYTEGQGYYLNFTQKKTGGVERLPISDQAVDFCGTRGLPGDRVFKDLEYSFYQSREFYHWMGSAGITKKITFHCFRHTYATLQLSHGTDLYTVSKMLGHRDIKTTQIYAKVIDSAKREAANRIKIDLSKS